MTNEKYLCELEARIAALEKENREYRAENYSLRERLEKLERRLAKYDNAHTPSSQKPYFDKTNSNQLSFQKPSGRPEGHEGTGRQTPKEIHEHKTLEPIGKCPDCGGPVKIKRQRKRVVTRLVPGHLENVEYTVPQCFCGSCRKTIEPIIPNTLPNNRFDCSFLVYVACLRMLGVSIDKIRFLLKTDYGLHVSSATIVNNIHKMAEFLGDDYEQLRQALLREKQVHGDETSWRVKGANSWLWEFISKRIAYFTVRKTRGHTVPAEVMGSYRGLFTSDFWNAYNVLSCEKQRCWVHLKRELDKVLKYTPSTEFAEFASQLLTLYEWVKSERKHGKKTREQAEDQLDVLLGQPYSNNDCRRLVKRLTRHQKELFVFCARRGAKSGNNDAERGIRPAVVLRKTSFGSQSAQGAQDTAVLMSFFQTARLQDENFVEFMHELTENHLRN